MIVKKDTINFILDKLYELKIQAEFEDRKRGKTRWVSKRSAYQDLIDLLEGIYEYNR